MVVQLLPIPFSKEKGSTEVSHTNLTTQADSVIDQTVMSNIMQLNQPNSIFYENLVKELRARELYQNLPDGIVATLSECRDLVGHFSLDYLATLSHSTLFDALTNVDFLNFLLI